MHVSESRCHDVQIERQVALVPGNKASYVRNKEVIGVSKSGGIYTCFILILYKM